MADRRADRQAGRARPGRTVRPDADARRGPWTDGARGAMRVLSPDRPGAGQRVQACRAIAVADAPVRGDSGAPEGCARAHASESEPRTRAGGALSARARPADER